MRFCDTCPAATFITEEFDRENYPEAVNAAQGLSGQMVMQVRGTKGLTDERIEEIRLAEIESWGGGEEAEALTEHPGLAQAVYSCEERVTILGSCAVHSKK